MKALVVDPKARPGLRYSDVAEPKPTSTEALVEVHAVSFDFGNASLEPSTLDFEQERSRGGDRRILVFTLGPTMGQDLSSLVELVSSGDLTSQIGWRGSWERAVEAADALLERRVRGKVVLDVRAGR